MSRSVCRRRLAALAVLLALLPATSPSSATAERPALEGYVVRLGHGGVLAGPGTSVEAGDSIGFALSAAVPLDLQPVVRDVMGRPVASLPAVRVGPAPARPAEPWREGSRFPVVVRWSVPAGLASGLYTLGGDPSLFLVVRRPAAAPAPVAVLLPTYTVNAYSVTEGRSLYPRPVQVKVVSFLRPQSAHSVGNWLPFLRWLEEERPFPGAVAYLTDADMDRRGLPAGTRVLIVLGHAEYWTRAARQRFDAFVAAGGHVVIAGGNVMWWQTRVSADGATQYQYRNTADRPVAEGGDPEPDPLLKTKLWRDPALAYPAVPSIGGDFSHAGFGQTGPENGLYHSRMTVIDGSHPLLAGTALPSCGQIDLPRSPEYDGAPILGLDGLGRPVPDLGAVGAHRLEVIAYEWNRNKAWQMGTMHLMQRTPTSGLVLHMGAMRCCLGKEFYDGPGTGKLAVQRILRNALEAFLAQRPPLHPEPPARPVAYPMSTPWREALPAVPPGPCAPPAGEPPRAAAGEAAVTAGMAAEEEDD